jgi:hypothetical protein
MPCIQCQKSGKPCIDATHHSGKKQQHLNSRTLDIESVIKSILLSTELQDCQLIMNTLMSNPVNSPSELLYNAQQHDQGLPIDSFELCSS